MRGNYPRQSETGLGIEFRVLFFGSFAPAGGQREHHHVPELAVGRLIAGRHHPFDDQHSATVVHRLAAVAQDHRGPLVVPVVDDVLEEVDVAARGNACEEVAALYPATAAPCRGFKLRSGSVNDIRAVIESAIQ